MERNILDFSFDSNSMVETMNLQDFKG